MPKYNVNSTDEFKKQVEKLARKFPKILDLVEDLFIEIGNGNIQGDRINNLKIKNCVVFKQRLENPDANKGKSGGFRAIYLLLKTGNDIYPLTIYSKSDQEDISKDEIIKILRKSGIKCD